MNKIWKKNKKCLCYHSILTYLIWFHSFQVFRPSTQMHIRSQPIVSSNSAHLFCGVTHSHRTKPTSWLSSRILIVDELAPLVSWLHNLQRLEVDSTELNDQSCRFATKTLAWTLKLMIFAMNWKSWHNDTVASYAYEIPSVRIIINKICFIAFCTNIRFWFWSLSEVHCFTQKPVKTNIYERNLCVSDSYCLSSERVATRTWQNQWITATTAKESIIFDWTNPFQLANIYLFIRFDWIWQKWFQEENI